LERGESEFGASRGLRRAVVEIRGAVAQRPVDADPTVAVVVRRARARNAVSGGPADSVHAAHSVRAAPAAMRVQYRRVATHVPVIAGPGPIAAQLGRASVHVRVGAGFVADAILRALEVVAAAARRPATVLIDARRAGITHARNSAIEAVVARPRLAMPRGRTALVFLTRASGASWAAGGRNADGAGGHRLLQAYRSIGAVRVRVAEPHRHHVGPAAGSEWSRSADGPQRAIVPVSASPLGERSILLTARIDRPRRASVATRGGSATRGATGGLRSADSGLSASSAACRSAGSPARTAAAAVRGAARSAAAGDFTTATA
jgi:hypothetical protein